MQIDCIIDNYTIDSRCVATHGFSLLIESDSYRILFDTGASDSTFANMSRLGIDPESIDAIVISHGHYDHCGGLTTLLEHNRNALVYLKKESLISKFRGKNKALSVQFSSEQMARFRFVDRNLFLTPDVCICPDIPIVHPEATHFDDFFIRPAEEFLPDTFEDELFLTVRTAYGSVVITGCAHRGLENIAESAQQIWGKQIYGMFGGFHLKDEPTEKADRLAEYLLSKGIAYIGVCHCTGVESYARLKSKLGEKAFYFGSGNRWMSTAQPLQMLIKN